MDRRLRFKTIGLAILTVLAICVLLPTFAGESLPSGFKQVFSKQITLGIDIKGGWYLRYDINLDKAVDDKAIELKRDLKQRIAEDLKTTGVVTAPSTPLGAVIATLDDPSKLEKLKAGFEKDYGEQISSITCPKDPARSLCIKVSSDYAESIRRSAIKQAVLTIRDRINRDGVAGPTVIDKQDEIIVELPGFSDERTAHIKGLIESAAKLEFKLVDEPLEGVENNSYIARAVGKILTAQGRLNGAPANPKKEVSPELLEFVKTYDVSAVASARSHAKSGKTFQVHYLSAPDTEISVTADEVDEWNCRTDSLDERKRLEKEGGECRIEGRTIIEKAVAIMARDHNLKIDDDHELGFQNISDPDELEDGQKPYWQALYLKRQAEVDGASLIDVQQSFDQQSGKPVVVISMNRQAQRQWGRVTTDNTGARFAIVFDGRITSAPAISEPILGGTSQIEMGAGGQKGIDEAKQMEGVLKSGSLPAPLVLESESKRGPSLGRDAVAKAQLSFILGSVLVLVLMVYFYRTSGMISILALALNIVFMLAVLVQFEAALTLPGIAALVLTVGMAVDANIIVYERIREELRLGKSVRGAVDAGFKHGFSAILDGQLTTAVAAYTLLQYTSEDAIRGFAVMLLIGIGCTLFTAYWCTKLFFEFYIGRKKDVVIGI